MGPLLHKQKSPSLKKARGSTAIFGNKPGFSDLKMSKPVGFSKFLKTLHAGIVIHNWPSQCAPLHYKIVNKIISFAQSICLNLIISFAPFLPLYEKTEESLERPSSFLDLSYNVRRAAQSVKNENYEAQANYGLIDAMHAIVRQNREDEERLRIVEARRKIGAFVVRRFNGVQYLGEVKDYDPSTKLYKVEYLNGSFHEYVDAEEVDRSLGWRDPILYYSKPRVQEEVPVPIVTYPVVNNFSRIEEEEKKEEEEGPKRKKPKPSGKKRGRPAKKPTTTPYVPLYKETKRDVYFWY
ncbi:uncharacterized protein LOC126653775 [Mercurialis annua]|uniref:uncharacterized protein LOC126653775 n=1 Tax=Mercurialis annua TaxID=3986 RepID=UPI0024ADA041|nr:uncharacterized protein LOC126653775 [Mercurialis annua]